MNRVKEPACRLHPYKPRFPDWLKSVDFEQGYCAFGYASVKQSR